MTEPHALNPRLVDDFDQTLARLAEAPAFSKYSHQSQLLMRAAKLAKTPGGVAALAERAERFDSAGVFAGTDWDMPAGLQPALVGPTLRAGGDSATLETLSELRLLALAEARTAHDGMSANEAQDFLAEAMAANLDLLFGEATETARERSAADSARLQGLFALLAERLGMGRIIERLLEEVSFSAGDLASAGALFHGGLGRRLNAELLPALALQRLGEISPATGSTVGGLLISTHIRSTGDVFTGATLGACHHTANAGLNAGHAVGVANGSALTHAVDGTGAAELTCLLKAGVRGAGDGFAAAGLITGHHHRAAGAGAGSRRFDATAW